MDNKFKPYDIVCFKDDPSNPHAFVAYSETGDCFVRDYDNNFFAVDADALKRFDIREYAAAVSEGTKNELFGSMRPSNTLNIDGNTIEIVHDENLILLIMRDANGKEVARSHAHVIHLGTAGVLQAVSYAMKRLYSDYMDSSVGGGRP